MMDILRNLQDRLINDDWVINLVLLCDIQTSAVSYVLPVVPNCLLHAWLLHHSPLLVVLTTIAGLITLPATCPVKSHHTNIHTHMPQSHMPVPNNMHVATYICKHSVYKINVYVGSNIVLCTSTTYVYTLQVITCKQKHSRNVCITCDALLAQQHCNH